MGVEVRVFSLFAVKRSPLCGNRREKGEEERQEGWVGGGKGGGREIKKEVRGRKDKMGGSGRARER